MCCTSGSLPEALVSPWDAAMMRRGDRRGKAVRLRIVDVTTKNLSECESHILTYSPPIKNVD